MTCILYFAILLNLLISEGVSYKFISWWWILSAFKCQKKNFSCLYLQKLSSLDVKIKDYTFPFIILKMLSSWLLAWLFALVMNLLSSSSLFFCMYMTFTWLLFRVSLYWWLWTISRVCTLELSSYFFNLGFIELLGSVGFWFPWNLRKVQPLCFQMRFPISALWGSQECLSQAAESFLTARWCSVHILCLFLYTFQFGFYRHILTIANIFFYKF